MAINIQIVVANNEADVDFKSDGTAGGAEHMIAVDALMRVQSRILDKIAKNEFGMESKTVIDDGK